MRKPCSRFEKINKTNKGAGKKDKRQEKGKVERKGEEDNEDEENYFLNLGENI